MRPSTLLVAATCLLPTAYSLPSSLFSLPTIDAQRAAGPPGNGSDPGEALYTNAVTYCAEAKAVLVDQFAIAYWRANNSVTFAFSFASIQSNLNVSASLYLNAYGMAIFDQEINLCELVSGVLCPLPQVNFTGFGTYPLPDGIQSQIPALAWTVPNLEAYARVELIDVATNETAACLQATLSNGWSTQYKGVKWGTGMFTLAYGLVGLAHAAVVNSISPAIYRWFDLLTLFQTAAAAGLMHLNYPLVFSNFVQNFHWSLGLFYNQPMQSMITTMRNNTGGKMPGDAYSEVQYINRRQSPYNVQFAVNGGVDLTNVLADATGMPSFISTLKTDHPYVSDTLADTLVKREKIPSTIDQEFMSNTTTGIPVFTNSMGVTQANAYTTVFFFFLAFLAIFIAFHVVFGAITWIFSRGRKIGWATRLRDTWWDFCAANGLRSCLVFFFPIFIFGFYQWQIGRRDSGLTIFLAVLGVLLVFAPLLTVFVLSILHARRIRTEANISPLYTDYHFYHAVGDATYRQFRQKYHFWWFAPVLLGMIIKAGFIGFGQANAWAQVIGCIAVEGLTLIAQLLFRPHKDRKGDWLGAFLTLMRMIYFGLLIAFIEGMHVKPIPRTAIGIVQIAVVGIPTVLLLFGLFFNAFYGLLWRRKKARVEDGTALQLNSPIKDKTQSEEDSTMQSLSPAAYGPGRNEGYGGAGMYPATSEHAQNAYDSAAAGRGGLQNPYDPPGRVSEDYTPYHDSYHQNYPAGASGDHNNNNNWRQSYTHTR
ncbi:hypothetical protein CcaverHIS002_0202040 [Cutaneotrichosporon cavernicola]|uniref:ML-like domain-containing protein n=1 Tax=Cutaneotrichosporon cavernicola TaxID=279322 RepID=A0AA48I854_9TREE|nr:uncharacterized protein CcaverHIS019_0202070 [Cutaneotrichosporon cavernicola]BEI81044.1 hypothetical protein CcaverHIS002_0202040 [Cutaneotrichosporon cavernicola]BEI88845.1 hypothetical protein CcaverHIS019_0202070 [Cutaneotrichosporon cavernicola]BEI96620.1 hypothetical protein CcaverHIS631_0202090 [Cutaneotrichosporon cavernicola]BEJ04392.1 hypothetical protein CcaverHIS641_0202090 [Cutaneotrichosporon cavernicola]